MIVSITNFACLLSVVEAQYVKKVLPLVAQKLNFNNNNYYDDTDNDDGDNSLHLVWTRTTSLPSRCTLL